MKRKVMFPLLLALLIPSTAVADAGLPKPSSSDVVVPISIAGIKLGMGEAEARAAWGKGRGECKGSSSHTGCEYGVFDNAAGSADLEFSAHKVTAIAIFGGENRAGDQLAVAGPPLAGIKTADGLGIGSKLGKLRRAYPNGRLFGSPRDERFSYVIEGRGSVRFTFALLGASERVYSLVLADTSGSRV
jgi:hypothetical protein